MEARLEYPGFTHEKPVSQDDVLMESIREAPPAHYTFKIQSFSLLSKASIERYNSDVFEVGGYKWNLALYPNGNKNENGKDHISLYLALAETKSLSQNWEVNVIFTLFVYDKIRDKYFYFQDGSLRRFHAMKTELGIPQFIKLTTFNNPSNGFLIDDTCVFGAEVSVIKSEGKGECLSMIKEDLTCKYTWSVTGFSKLGMECIDSNAFVVGDYKWKIRLFPKGDLDGKGNSISVYLTLADSTSLPPNSKLYVKYILRVIGQFNSKHVENEATNLFSLENQVWGWTKFMTLCKLNHTQNYFLYNDKCIISADVTVLGLVKKLS